MPTAQFAPDGWFRAMWYRALLRIGRLLLRAERVSAYLATALLSKADVEHASQLAWTASDWRNSLNQGLTPFELEVYSQFLSSGDRVLLIGCGAGRDLVGLLRLGIRVTGLDQSAQNIAASEQRLAAQGLSTDLICGLVQHCPLNGPYDAIVFGGASYSCIIGANSRITVLGRLEEILNPRGRILIGHVCSNGIERTVGRGAAALLLRWTATWQPEPGDSVRMNHIRRVPVLLHWFARGEVMAEATAAGYTSVGEHHRETIGVAIVSAGGRGSDRSGEFPTGFSSS